MSRAQSRVAYAEDADDSSGSDCEVIEGTRKYARSEAPTELSKELPNTGKSRMERPSYRHSRSPSLSDSEDDSDDSTERQRMSRRPPPSSRDMRELDRRRIQRPQEEDPRMRGMRGPPQQQQMRKVRPPLPKHAATQPIIQQGGYRRGHVEDPSFYGVQQPAGSRPRANTRPASYYAGQGSRPPMAGGNMSWGHPPPAPMPFPVGTFPPPQQMYPPMNSAGSRGGPMPSPSNMSGYFDMSMASHNPALLKQRFDMRPSSAIGFQSQGQMGYPPGHGHDPRGPPHHPGAGARRPSMSRQKRDMDDRRKMPPPDFIPKRPQSAALPPSTPFRPPQRPPSRQQPSRSSHRRSIGFSEKRRGYDDDDFVGEEALFHDISPEPAHEQQRRQNIARARRALVQYDDESEEEDDDDDDDDDEGYGLVPADPRGRRGSMYGSRALGTGGVSLDEDKYLDAIRYQTHLGASNMPLTAESLRRVTKPRGVPSSRSTRSSGSHDESDYKRSNTTGITKSSSHVNSDDVTIKLSGGGAIVTMGNGAEMDVAGGEIRFRSRPAGARSGSEHTNSVFQLEDARGRYERKALPYRSRAPSQSDSQSRGGYLAHAPYEPAFADNYF